MNPNEAHRDDELVIAAEGATEFEAQTKAVLLKDEGIEAFVFPAERAWTGGLAIGPNVRGVPVWVRKGDLERAASALKQRIADSVDLDWSEVDVGEMESDSADHPSRGTTGVQWLARFGWTVAALIILLLIYTFVKLLIELER